MQRRTPSRPMTTLFDFGNGALDPGRSPSLDRAPGTARNALMGALDEADGQRRLQRARVVAFDLDCTLIDILAVKRAAAEAATWTLADAGLDVEPVAAADDLLQMGFRIGIDRSDLVEQFVRRLVGEPEPRLIDAASQAFDRAEDAAARPYPRAHRTLHELGRRGYRLALVSDAPRPRVVQRLHATRLASFFDPVLTLEDSPAGKADVRPYEELVARTSARPDEIVMVGDNPVRDIGNARAFGCQTVLARYGLQEVFASDHPAHRAHHEIRWLDDLLALLPGPAPLEPSGSIGNGGGHEAPLDPRLGG